MTRRLRTPATLEQATETETPLGGRKKSWTVAAQLWVAFAAVRLAERTPAATGAARELASPERATAETTAEARDHPLAARGMRLSADGQVWRVAAVDRGRPAPGRMTLILIKD